MQDAPHALYFETGPEYLQVMHIPLLQGRFFTAEDTSNSAPVVVIDSVLAHTYFPHKDPVGELITVAHWRTARVIGVVGHVRHWGLGDTGTCRPQPNLYFVLSTFGRMDADVCQGFIAGRAHTARSREHHACDQECRLRKRQGPADI